MRPGRVAPRSHGPAFVALAVLLGFLLSVGALQERLREAELPGRAVQLRALIEQRRGTVEELMAEVARLSERVGELQGSSDAGPQELERLLRRLARLRTIAGMAPVAGPGLVVTLTDSARPPRTSEEESDLRIQDVDLQIVINALWQAGAEAVTVNGQRVVSTTAIRRAGSFILVNYHAVASPYRVSAIGDADGLRQGLDQAGVVRRFEVWQEVYGLGFSARPADRLVAPASAAAPEITWAQPQGSDDG